MCRGAHRNFFVFACRTRLMRCGDAGLMLDVSLQATRGDKQAKGSSACHRAWGLFLPDFGPLYIFSISWFRKRKRSLSVGPCQRKETLWSEALDTWC